MTATDFRKRTGREPENDDLERVNCGKSQQPGHYSCGWCEAHNRPRWECREWLPRGYVRG